MRRMWDMADQDADVVEVALGGGRFLEADLAPIGDELLGGQAHWHRVCCSM
jgi:hypothetical protein